MLTERSDLRDRTAQDEGNSRGTPMRDVWSILLSRVSRKRSQRTTTVRIQLARVLRNMRDASLTVV